MTLGQPSIPCSPAMYALVTALADATGEAREMELRRKWLDGSHDQAVVEVEGTAWTALTVAIGEVEAREAALTAEVERLRGILEPKPHESLEMAALRAVGDARTLPILDRAFVVLGGCGFENTEDAARRVMGDLAAARADAANARLIATEAIEIADSLVTIAKRGYVLRGRVANLATLRARLTSPEPAKEN